MEWHEAHSASTASRPATALPEIAGGVRSGERPASEQPTENASTAAGSRTVARDERDRGADLAFTSHLVCGRETLSLSYDTMSDGAALLTGVTPQIV